MKALLQDLLQFLPAPWRLLAIPAIVFVAVAAAGLVSRRLLFAKLHKWARTTRTRGDEHLLDSLHGPMLIWVLILAIYAATDIPELPPALLYWAERALLVLWIVSLTVAASRLAGRLVQIYAAHKPGAAPTGTLSQVLASLAVGSLGVLMLLRAFGIEITTILATFGVGGLAVALALQDEQPHQRLGAEAQRLCRLQQGEADAAGGHQLLLLGHLRVRARAGHHHDHQRRVAEALAVLLEYRLAGMRVAPERLLDLPSPALRSFGGLVLLAGLSLLWWARH